MSQMVFKGDVGTKVYIDFIEDTTSYSSAKCYLLKPSTALKEITLTRKDGSNSIWYFIADDNSYWDEVGTYIGQGCCLIASVIYWGEKFNININDPVVNV